MAAKRLRLRNDPPYSGESLSSFVERTAQFYGTPINAFLSQLMEGHDWSVRGYRDLDLNPPDVLQSRLADSVQGWRSPLAEHRGFHGWVMAPSLRHAYCPICFTMDLTTGRTPYFRMDWAPFSVTICWEHGTPLFEWKTRDSMGHRRLPQAWLYRKRFDEVVWPGFFIEHCRFLLRLIGQGHDEKGLVNVASTGRLYGLQAAIEKRSTKCISIYPLAQDPRDDMRSLARTLVLGVAEDIGTLRAISDEVLGLTADDAWVSLSENGISSYLGGRVVRAIRQTKTLEVRKTCLLFAARTLAGSRRYGRIILPDPAVELPWRVFLRDHLQRGVGDQQRATLEQLIAMWGDHLDESAPPSHLFGIGSDYGQMWSTQKWIRSWLTRYVLNVWE